MQPDLLSAKLAALAHPTRRAMLQRLTQGDVTVQELSQPFAISAPGITKHLKILEKSGLISRSRAPQTRPCHLVYEAMSEVGAWVDQLVAVGSGGGVTPDPTATDSD